MMKYGKGGSFNQIIKVEFPNAQNFDLDNFREILSNIDENKNPFLHKYISIRSQKIEMIKRGDYWLNFKHLN